MQINGSCHCGNISFALTCEPPPAELPARACGCGFCTRHRARWTTLPTAALKVTIQDATHHARYAFETRTAQFHICTRCGVVPLVTSSIDGRLYAAVNSNTFEDFDRSRLRPAAASFDGESAAARLARRARNWIADVEFSVGT